MLDGELIIPVGDILSFDALQMRLHPAESRIRKLAAETPAQLMLFDCLAAGRTSGCLTAARASAARRWRHFTAMREARTCCFRPAR